MRALPRADLDAASIGRRFAAARHIAGMTQEAAADALGLKLAELADIEAGARLPSVRRLALAAVAYDTSVDYLLCLADEDERDPAALAHRHAAAQVAAAADRIAASLASVGVEAVRALAPDANLIIRLASSAVEAEAALQRLRTAAPEFDLMPGSARVLRAVNAASDAGHEHLAQQARATRRAELRQPLDFAAIVGATPT